jgi:hypothetical protein
MLVAAILVGLLATYYFGIRPGVIAAGVTAALLLVALVVPGLALWVYAAVGVGVFGILTAGPRLRRRASAAHFAILARTGVRRVQKAMRSFGGSKGDRGRN